MRASPCGVSRERPRACRRRGATRAWTPREVGGHHRRTPRELTHCPSFSSARPGGAPCHRPEDGTRRYERRRRRFESFRWYRSDRRRASSTPRATAALRCRLGRAWSPKPGSGVRFLGGVPPAETHIIAATSGEDARLMTVTMRVRVPPLLPTAARAARSRCSSVVRARGRGPRGRRCDSGYLDQGLELTSRCSMTKQT